MSSRPEDYICTELNATQILAGARGVVGVMTDGTYVLSDGTKIPPMVFSSAAPSNNDGRPDGTFYVQTV